MQLQYTFYYIQFVRITFMKVITFAAQKGGAGKSTLAKSIGTFLSENYRVLIIDLDPQGTLLDWYEQREEKNPIVTSAETKDLKEALKALSKSETYDFVIIDTQGRDYAGTSEAIKRSDVVFIPIRDSVGDTRANIKTAITAQNQKKPFAWIPNQLRNTRSIRSNELDRSLKTIGTVSPVRIAMRYDFPDAQGNGQGVTEYSPKDKSADEIKKLTKWILTFIEKIDND